MKVKGNKYPAKLSSNTEAIAATLQSRKLKMVFIKWFFFCILGVQIILVLEYTHSFVCKQFVLL